MGLTSKQQAMLNDLLAKQNGGGNNNNRNNNNRSNGGGNYDPNNYVKKSGAGHKLTVTKNAEQKPVTWGWKANKMLGITKYLCTVTKHTKKVTSKTGKVWLTGIAVTIINAKLGTKGFSFGMMELATGKVIVKDLSLVINPKAPNGGVVGTIGAGK